MKHIIHLFAFLLVANITFAQCGRFAETYMVPLLDGYSPNDNCNYVVLSPGEHAELLLTFYPGKDYRLAVGGHEILGDINFEIRDIYYRLIFSNKDRRGNLMTYDFEPTSTELLLVLISVPEKKKAIGTHMGCVTVMSGYKEGTFEVPKEQEVVVN